MKPIVCTSCRKVCSSSGNVSSCCRSPMMAFLNVCTTCGKLMRSDKCEVCEAAKALLYLKYGK